MSLESQHVLTYNGITLKLAKHEHSCSLVYSTDETTPLYKRMFFSVQAVVNKQTNGGSTVNATYLTTLRKMLAEPRKELTYTIGGVTYLSIPTGGDAKHGPRPIDVVVFDRIIGNTILIHFSIEAWISECDSSQGPPNILSNRWTQTHEIDKLGFSTLTTEGELIIRGGQGKVADDFRTSPFPVSNIPAGFVRENQKFTQSSDGLTLNWVVVDREPYKPGTQGIVNWEADYTESSDYEGSTGALLIGQMRVSAVGVKTVSKQVVMDWAIAVMFSRLSLTSDLLRSYSIQENLHENKVTLSVNVITNTNNAVQGGMMRTTTRIGAVVPPVDNYPATQVSTRGYTGLKLLSNPPPEGACDSRTPTLSVATIGSSSPGTVSVGTSSAANGEISTTNNGTLSSDQVSSGHPYMVYKCSAEIETAENMLALPVSKATTVNQLTFTRLASPTTKKTVRWYVERIGAEPTLPAYQIDDNHVKQSRRISLQEIETLPDGKTRIYKVAGEYRYGLKDGSDAASYMTLPKSPMLQSNSEHVQATNTSIIPPS